jgi:NAD-dependent SIR2 family protein deacetylase
MKVLPSSRASTIRSDVDDRSALSQFVARHPKLFVLTGAGCSTASGIPDYRDAAGSWKQTQPVSFQAFMGDQLVRRRYWARSLVGWRRFGHAAPNDAHRALACLERRGGCEVLVTQNVDRLHQAAGSERVVDLHGRLDKVRCMTCERRSEREELQAQLIRRNPAWAQVDGQAAPDGDAQVHGRDFSRFEVPDCANCGGILKPDVVFFGESVPGDRVATAMAGLDAADAMLVVGSSLMVYSGYRFAKAAFQGAKPIAAVNIGITRADQFFEFKVNEPCARALDFLLEQGA